MPTFHHDSFDSYSSFLATLGQYADAGIDLALDAGMEELERQFAELRLAINHD